MGAFGAAGLEAGVFVVDALGAEVLRDEGGVEMPVVVVELEVVGFVVLGVVEIDAVAAVAEGAFEIIAVVGAGVEMGEAGDFARVGVFFGYLDGGDGGDEGGDEAEEEEEGEGELLERKHFSGQLSVGMYNGCDIERMWKGQYIFVYIYMIYFEGLWKGGRTQEVGGKRGEYIGSLDQDCAIITGRIKL